MKTRWVNTETHIIYDNGLVWSIKTQKYLKPHISRGGYRQIFINGKREYLHRLIAKYFVPKNGKPEVNHKDADKSNNDASNLEWVTRSENMSHAHSLGIGPRKNGFSLKNDINEIKRLIKNGITRDKIAKKYKVSQTTIHRIAHNLTYRHCG